MSHPIEIRHILVPLDGSGTAEWAIPRATAIARRAEARLHLVIVHTSLAHAFPDVTAAGYLEDWERKQRQHEEQYVDDLAERLREAGIDARAGTGAGDPIGTLVDRAAGMDLVVMTAHGWAGPERSWLGHVADGIVHHVRVPVLITRAERSRAPDDPATSDADLERIMVATDGSDAARAAERHGVLLGRLFDAHLTLFRAVRAPVGPSSPYIPHAAALDRAAASEWEEEARSYLSERAAGIEGIDVTTRVDTTYHAARAILEAATDGRADLIAVGTHRDNRLARAVLGSVADKVVRGVRIPVLIAHADRS